jgi:hypothetical protein
MYISINTSSQFRDHFAAMGRNYHFSYEAMNLLYEFLEENIEGYELDVIALCCEYAEDTLENIAMSLGVPVDSDVVDYLEQHTQVIGVTAAGTILYAQF